LSAAAAAAHDRAGLVISRIIFLFFSLAVLVIQPLRGVGALSSEMKGRTIDLMVLTRLSAWRIVTGKWVSLVSQSALLLAAIVPYLILRYFFGGMQLFSELLALGCVFLASGMLTAVMVGLSACGSLLVRGILPVLGTPLLVGSIFGVTLSGSLPATLEFFTLSSRGSWVVFAACLGIGAYLTWMALDFGASQIGPRAENRATARRLVCLAATFALAALGFWSNSGWIVVGLTVVLTPVIAVSFTEPGDLVPVVTKPFVRRGFPGLVCGRFLYPCWPAGVLFCVVPCAVVLAEGVLLARLDGTELNLLVAWLGSLLFPAVWVTLFRRKVRNAFATYVLILASSLILLFVVGLLQDAMRNEIVAWMFCWLPPAQAVMFAAGRVSHDLAMAVSCAVNGLYFLILFLAALIRFPVIRAAEIESANDRALTSDPPASA